MSQISHSTIWAGIDKLANRHGLSVSGLARLAGLDATAFNKSKRISKDGRERWPSTESLAKVLDATGETFDQFLTGGGLYLQTDHDTAGFAEDADSFSIPLLRLSEAGTNGFFDAGGSPVGDGWDEIEMPASNTSSAYALEICGSDQQPVYRDGDFVIVAPSAQVRRGDRVVVRTLGGEVMIMTLHRQTAKQVELHPFNPERTPVTLALTEIEWIARIVWASQ